MPSPIRQIFPRPENGRITHQSWDLDLAAAIAFCGHGSLTSARLEHDATEMAEHFPRWILTVSCGRDLRVCKHCRGMLVFAGGLRCVVCGREARREEMPKEPSLAWFGLLPPIGVDGLAKIKDRLEKNPPKGHVVGRREDIGSYLLVPLVAAYPRDYPADAPAIFYLPGFFAVPGMPADAASHEYHLFGSGQMCLFAAGQWRKEMTIREVLQQRAYAHVIKLLNYANGKKNAFKIVS